MKIKAATFTKPLLLSTLISLNMCMFLGLFANAPLTMDESFSGPYWYYINRGYPTAWAGVSLARSKVDYPLVKLPLLTMADDRGTSLSKIVDLSLIFPTFAKIALVTFIGSFSLAQFSQAKSVLTIYSMFIYLTLTTGILMYFILFRTI